MNEALKSAIRLGLLAGVIILYTALIGMIEVFSERSIIEGWVTLGQLLMFVPALLAGFIVANRIVDGEKERSFPITALLHAAIAGFCVALPLIGLLALTSLIEIRPMFVNVTQSLITLLTFDLGRLMGGLSQILIQTGLGFIGAVISFIPALVRRPLTTGLIWVIVIGLLSELFIQIIRPLFGMSLVRQYFQSNALRPSTAGMIFIVLVVISIGASVQQKTSLGRATNPTVQSWLSRLGFGLLGILLLALPWVLGSFLSEVLANVGLFILMGLGLNIAIGLAGLLDLGYVTNFAVGAYVMAVLTSTGPLGIGQLNFWLVLPVSLLAAMFTGFVLALPVLRMRGDYLAIATLGFGEIIRILALSDWLRPYIGGAQGVLAIPKATLFGFSFSGPQQIYYLILGACLVTLFVMLRLDNSRTGRQWMAMREDEDVAASMGIDVTKTKVLAFTLSAATGGVAGAIFASKLGTIFPHSFNLLISINALSLIIIGGIGSIPGIVIGALVLIGLPELLREFAEYRLLLYGALLVIMMLLRPEGLWPSAVRRRELQSEADPSPAVTGD